MFDDLLDGIIQETVDRNNDVESEWDTGEDEGFWSSGQKPDMWNSNEEAVAI